MKRIFLFFMIIIVCGSAATAQQRPKQAKVKKEKVTHKNEKGLYVPAKKLTTPTTPTTKKQ